MKDLIDIHTHSISSGHAYSTLQENLQIAKEKGLKYYGLSDHAPELEGSATWVYFSNLQNFPKNVYGLNFLAGIELNVMDYEGNVDEMPSHVLPELDYAIASLHTICLKPGTREENTNAYLEVLKNPYVKVLGHPDDGRYDFDPEAIVKQAKKYHVAIEVNNSSLKPNAFRANARDVIVPVLEYCMQYRVPVIMNSDAHYSFDVGNHEYAEKLLKEINFVTDLVINYHEHLIEEYILTPHEQYIKGTK